MIHEITRNLTNEPKPIPGCQTELSGLVRHGYFILVTTHLKRVLAVLVASLVSSTGWVGTSRAQTTDAIQSIRKQYAAINQRVARYRKVRKELSGFSAEGGRLIAYLDGTTIVKITASYYGETGKADEEYYYQDGKLIFVYRKEST